MLSNTRCYLQGTLTKSDTTVSISNDNRGNVASFSGESLVFVSADGKTIEQTKGGASAGTLTLTKRGVTNSATLTESSALKQERRAGTQVYITALAPDFVVSSSDNTFTGTQTFNNITVTGVANLGSVSDLNVLGLSNPQPNFATTVARDAVYTSPLDGDKCTVAGTSQTYNGSTAQRESYGVSTPLPSATESVEGKAKIATTPIALAGTNDTDFMTSLKTKAVVDSRSMALTDNTFQAGEAITAGQCVYLKSSDSKLYLTDSDAVGTSDLYGISTESVSSGAYPAITIQGINKNQTGLTAGANYYLSGTPGAISTTPGTNSIKVGYGLTTTSLVIDKTSSLASDLVMVTRTTGLVAAGGAYTKHREYISPVSGVVRVQTNASAGGNGSSSSTIYVKVYKNGIAVGVEHNIVSTSSTTPVTGSYNDDISVVKGDLIQVYTYGVNNQTCSLTAVYIKYNVVVLPTQAVTIT